MDEHAALVAALMSARRRRRGIDPGEGERARREVDRANIAWASGVRCGGPMVPDYNRRLERNTPYAAWFARTSQAEGDGVRRGRDKDSAANASANAGNRKNRTVS